MLEDIKSITLFSVVSAFSQMAVTTVWHGKKVHSPAYFRSGMALPVFVATLMASFAANNHYRGREGPSKFFIGFALGLSGSLAYGVFKASSPVTPLQLAVTNIFNVVVGVATMNTVL